MFFKFFWQFFTRIPEIIGTFRERFIFQIIGVFLLFMYGFYTMEPRHIDQQQNETVIILTKYSSKREYNKN